MADVISRLRLESGEFDSKIKRAGQELLAYSEHCKKTGVQMGFANKDAKDFAAQLGKMSTTATTTRGKISELSDAFVNLKIMYNQMTDAEKKGQFGKNLSASLDQLKGRINDAKKDLSSVTNELNGSKFGQFGNVIDTIGHKLGLTTNATELLTSKTALMYSGIGAGIAIIGKATQEWAAYNAELAKQDQITTVTTGLKGPGADAMTDAARAMVDTYNVDFREAINAANTLMSQFGVSGSEAIQLLRDGMQGMIQGDGPKLLSMIQQYAPAFRDAGISASQLVAVIHNSEGGIFTDQNMNAIVMGIKNIRLMTNATSEALAKLGIDGQDMSRKLSDGSMTIFDALKQVAGAIKNVDSNSKAAGEVMQQVFGRQGVTAGTNLGKAIETLNTNLEETKRQTGEVGDAFAELQTANEKLNIAIRDCFEYDGWDQMAKGIQAKLVTALANVLQMISNIKGALGGFSVGQQQGDIKNGGGSFIDNAVDKLKGGKTPGKERMMRNQIQAYTKQIFRINDQIADIQNKIGEDMDGNMSIVYEKQIRTLENRRDAIRKNMNEYERRANEVLNAPGNTHAANNIKPLPDTKPTKSGGNRSNIDTQQQRQDDRIRKQYEDAMRKAEREIVLYAGEISTAIEVQKKIDKANRDLESAQKRLVDAQRERSTAKESGDLKAYYAAEKKVTAAQQEVTRLETVKVNIEQGKVDLPDMPKPNETVKVSFKATTQNIDAQIAHLKEEMSQLQVGSIQFNMANTNMVDMTTLQTIVNEQLKAGLTLDPAIIQSFYDQITSGADVVDEKWKGLLETLNESRKAMNLPELNIDLKTGKVQGNDEEEKGESLGDKYANMVGGLSSVASGLQQMGIKLPEGVQKLLGIAQGIMSVVSGVGTIISVFQIPLQTANNANLMANSTSLMTNTFTMGALIEALWANSASNWFGFANGGIVPHAANGFNGTVGGNHYSGDVTPILANAGEVVLNRAQVGNLADQLEGSNTQNMRLEATVRGEDIRLALNNNGRRTGRGEYVQSTRRM